MKFQLENEKIIDPGIPMDVIIVNNTIGDTEADNIINSFDGTSIFNGHVSVFTRENLGGSFGAFSYAYDLLSSEYDYFLFNEDDILITHHGYFKRAIEVMSEDNTVGFVAFSPISHGSHDPVHCGGGFGVSSGFILEKIKNKFGKLPYNQTNSYSSFENSEILFTNSVNDIGYSIVNVPEYSPLAENYLKHTSQNKPHYITEENLNKTFIYKVGL